jgi:hypothetical protein
MAEPSVSSIAIYQLRVLLCGVSPLVWRRLLVISETSLAELHEILQTAFAWSGEHLHRFLIHGAAYWVPCLGGILVKFQQRYQMRNRILSKAVPALEFCPFCNSQNCVLLVGQFWVFDSDRILQLFV